MKHAYLIMAHHRLDLLNELLMALDDADHDFFVHIDVKCKETYDFKLKYSRLIFIDRMDVRWAGYSQVQCELNLLKAAMAEGRYDYYHLLTGATYPLKSKDAIKRFFEENQGKQFIAFDANGDITYDRVKNHFLFSELGKANKLWKRGLRLIRKIDVRIQNLFHIDYFWRFDMEYKKGLAYFSITDELATHIVTQEETIRKMLKHSISGDEVFMQTLTYNSRFRDDIYDMTDEYRGCQVCAAWPRFTKEEREGNNFVMKDLDLLLNCEYLFGIKFEGKDGLALIETIREKNGRGL